MAGEYCGFLFPCRPGRTAAPHGATRIRLSRFFMIADANAPASRAGSLLLPILISVALAIFLMTLMPTTMFWDRDEAFYARAAVEMIQSGNWILPTYNDDIFPDKPPLIYWLMAVFMHVFGQNEFAARFVSAPATAGSAFLIFLIGSRLFDRRAGLCWSRIIYF